MCEHVSLIAYIYVSLILIAFVS